MMSDNAEIIKSINSVYGFTAEQVDAFCTKLKPKKLARKEYLLGFGQKCNFMAFILKGSLRYYSETETADMTLNFFTENTWVADYESFISQKPTQNYLQALEPTELKVITLDDIHCLIEQYPPFRNLASFMSNWAILTSHYTSMINLSPDQRYAMLLRDNPKWVNRFPQMYIASYLGITKETLSRVKSRIS